VEHAVNAEAKADIEQILQTDETAWEMLGAARARAERVRADAREKAAALAAQKREELTAAANAESERILAEARSKAQTVLDATRRYLEGQEEKKKVLLGELVEALLGRVIGP
jgi:vacuolar-type H+-ATPase subunit H